MKPLAENSCSQPAVLNRPDHFDAIMTGARRAQAKWAAVPLADRLNRVRALRQLIARQAGELAASLSAHSQRSEEECLTAEIIPLAEACRFLERDAARILAPQTFGSRHRPVWLHGVRAKILREPFGVVLIIGPGNYPLLLPGVQVLQALAAGNSVVLKPGAGASHAASAMLALMHRAGFDPALVTLLPESTQAARSAIEARPDKVFFTGSAAVGEKILAQLAPLLIPATLELSGSDAVIVRADADLGLAVKALGFGLTLNGGGTCLAPKRVFVQRSIATELEGRLARWFAEHAARSGPEIHSHGRPRFPDHVSDGHKKTAALTRSSVALWSLVDEAIAQGAHFITSPAGAGDGKTPIVLAGVDPAARLLREDLFAPVLSLITVGGDDEAVALANAGAFGLGASVFTRDEAAGWALAARLQAGVVSVNDLIVPTADARLPFGGRKRSGFGSTRGAEGLLEMTVPKGVTVSTAGFRPAFEATKPGDKKLFLAYLRVAHGNGWKERIRALLDLIKFAARRRKTRND